MIQEVEKVVQIIKQWIKTAQNRHKKNVDDHWKNIKFNEGEYAFLNISPGKEWFILIKKEN